MEDRNNYPISSDRLIQILSHAKDGVAVYISVDLQIAYINEAMLKLWRKKNNITGLLLSEAAPEFNEFIPILQEVWRTGKSYTATDTYANIDVDGVLTPTPFDFTYHPVLDESEKVVAIINTATEVTERMAAYNLIKDKEVAEHQTNEDLQNKNSQLQILNDQFLLANQELHSATVELSRINKEHAAANSELGILNEKLVENEDTLTLALQAAELGSYDLNINTGLMECSDQCKLNFGRNRNERFDFKDLIECILPECRSDVTKKVNNAIQLGSLYSAEYQIRRPDGTTHWIKANGSPRYDSEGNVYRIVGVTQVITERKNYELRKDEYLSVASHELKTPLTVLRGNLQLLDKLKDRLDNEMAIKLIESSMRSMERITGLVDNLLDMGKYAEGKVELKKTTFDLLESLRNSYADLPDLERQKILLKGHPIVVQADEGRIGQVITNFLNNAFRYAPDSKEITLELCQYSTEVRVMISDQGPGIAQDQLAYLFERYRQVGEKSSGKGLGLGLYISSEIIKAHGGEIGVESQVGRGSTFWFTLPI